MTFNFLGLVRFDTNGFQFFKMASKLSEDELRSRLLKYGVDAGPIEPTTRWLYEKRLNELIQQTKKGRVSKRNTSTSLRSRSNRSYFEENSFSDQSDCGESTVSEDRIQQRNKPSISRTSRSISDNDVCLPKHRSDNSYARKSLRNLNSYNNIYPYKSEYNFSDSENESNHTQKPKPSLFKKISLLFNKKGHTSNSMEKNGYSFNSTNRYTDALKAGGGGSHYVSRLLLTMLVVFFFSLAMLYISFQSHTYHFANLTIPRCGESTISRGDYSCIESRSVNETLEFSSQLYMLVSEAAGDHYCGSRELAKVSGDEISRTLLPKFPHLSGVRFYQLYMYSLLLLRENPQLQVKLHYNPGSREQLTNTQALEALRPAKSLWCRWQKAFSYTLAQLFWLALVLLLVLVVYLFCRYKYRQRELRKTQMYGLVEKIIELLKEQYEKSVQEPGERPYLAVAHIRDSLIPLPQRQSMQDIWEQAAEFLEANESRVRVESKDFAGEKFKVWRWIQSTTLSPNHGRIWQGQAFGINSQGHNILPFSPTAFLKIRNMFDSQIESGPDWTVAVKDAILEKCEGCSVVHIHVDINSSEGCVYLKCRTSDDAYRTYRALHGWWFGGKLVTVKFLRPERYHDKFPEAVNCSHPLKPSNNLRLSLAASPPPPS